MTTTNRHRLPTSAALVMAALMLSSCSTLGDSAGDDNGDSANGHDNDAGSNELTIVTHDSFEVSDELIDDFETETGYDITWVAPGDGGALVNQLVLTKDNPLGDAVYGIDNSFGARAVDEGVLADYEAPEAPAEHAIFDAALTPIDFGDVCLNIDHEWFAEHDLEEPDTFQDLTKDEYADLLVVTNPATSSPGLSFLLATVGAFGAENFADYWQELADNGLEVAEGWSDAYYVDFSGSEGEGPRPLVVSYSSSPPAEVPEGAEEAPTGVLLDTCFRQTEFAGVLEGADNPEGAQDFIDFMLSSDVQADIPGSMFMYPAREDVDLPEDWEAYAPSATDPHDIDPAEIAEHRDEWIEEWTEIVTG